jgi:hypothetical protein
MTVGSFLIRSLFFQEKEDGFHILPCLPPQFICGKMIQIATKNGCIVDLEWSKRRIRKMRITTSQDLQLQLHLPSDIKEFRLKASSKDRGRVISSKEEILSVRAQDTLWLDRFQR